MTKLIQMRVVIAVDDEVDLKDAKARLEERISANPTETVGAEPVGRMHWATVNVLQGPERVPGRARAPRAKEVTT